MKKFVDYVFGILASLDFGVFYPVIVSSAVASVFLITMIVGFFVYRIRSRLHPCRRENRLRFIFETDKGRVCFFVYR